MEMDETSAYILPTAGKAALRYVYIPSEDKGMTLYMENN
jgi:hypothetical protein